MTSTRSFEGFADDVRARPGPVRLVGIDGCGGAGKTTFAGRLADAGGGWPVIHTDDFASHEVPMQWWPRMLREVIEPLSDGRPATFAPYDWVERRFGAAVTVAPAEVVLIEGVGATRRAWRDRLSLRVWVAAPRDVRLERGIARDGEQLREFWRDWMAAEDGYVDVERPQDDADLVIDGNPVMPHDREREFVVIEPPSARVVAEGR